MIPALAVQQAGQGVQTADNMNTAVQGGALLADLRSFPALNNMTAVMMGYVAVGDGGQGVFVFSSAATAADDGGVTTIAPYAFGSLNPGRWLRIGFLTPSVSYLYQTPASGFSTQIPNNVYRLLLNPSGTLATGSIQLPAAPIDGQFVSFVSSQAVTALTLTALGTISNPVTSLAAGVPANYQYVASAATWFKA